MNKQTLNKRANEEVSVRTKTIREKRKRFSMAGSIYRTRKYNEKLKEKNKWHRKQRTKRKQTGNVIRHKIHIANNWDDERAYYTVPVKLNLRLNGNNRWSKYSSKHKHKFDVHFAWTIKKKFWIFFLFFHSFVSFTCASSHLSAFTRPRAS